MEYSFKKIMKRYSVIDLSQDTQGKRKRRQTFSELMIKHIYILERVDFSIAENRKNKEIKK